MNAFRRWVWEWGPAPLAPWALSLACACWFVPAGIRAALALPFVAYASYALWVACRYPDRADLPWPRYYDKNGKEVW